MTFEEDNVGPVPVEVTVTRASSDGEPFTLEVVWFDVSDRLHHIQANSDSFLRGDEGNDVSPIDGYTVLNAHATFEISDRLQVFLSVANVLDAEYESFGLFGEADEVLGSEFDDTRFVSPGSPRAAWFGFELSR